MLVIIFFISMMCNSPLFAITNNKLLPQNDVLKDRSFADFYKDLEFAIKNKDVNFIKKITSSKINFSFGYEPGYKKNPIGTFIRYSKLDKNSSNSSFWKNLKSTIRLGCVKKASDYFECPYVLTNWPNLDVYTFVATITNDAEIKSSPSKDAKTIKRVSFEIIKIAPSGMKGDWYAVLVNEGKNDIGYIHKRKVRSPVGHRAYFKKVNNEWKLTTFIAGD